MPEAPSDLYLKLLGETARISWHELQPFFARGALLRVAAGLDLIEVAAAFAANDQARVAVWLENDGLAKLPPDQAQQWHEQEPQLWAVVVAPWVLAQEHNVGESSNSYT
ncbi:DUF2288 domain-containing protein [Azomonas macrocytogenes]|uniref:DUF2288 domain-containing protein n=1 Tax=Azomonas macrocytogenes TaxID=69962 RepID=A0A839T1A8_AZOMA|nr:DUF2288 domain-containing protein [Azomonas macrocytogenes]MBB3102296.1 hypothetical protein [Azomonas macrocytogenes]